MGRMSGEPIKLDIIPGLYTEETDTGAGTRWVDCDLIRFKNSLVETIGGWVKKTLTGSIPMWGIPRSLHDFVALDGSKYIAVGTEKRLYLIDENLVSYNITPIREEGTLTNPFFTSTTGAYDPNAMGNASYFKVSDTNHGVSVGDLVTFNNFDPVGGLTIAGHYEVVTVTDTNNYVLKHANNATSTVSGGGGLGDYIYEITVGGSTSGVASGWGTGGWDEETWNTPRQGSTFFSELRTWSLQNWGEDLVASPRDSAIYVWDKSGGTTARAAKVTQAPASNLRVLVSAENRQMISLGAHNGVSRDPLFIAWSDTEDYTTWIPAVGNTAGDRRIDQGSEIITGLPTRVGILIFTDTGVHIMQPTGGDQVYSFRQIGSGMSIAGPSAAADANGIVYMMGKTNFYVFDGAIRPLPSPVWGRVFGKGNDGDPLTALNVEQSHSVFCSHSKNFNEVWWFYPSGVNTSNDRYVVYNYVEEIWYFGDMARSSFHDFSPFVSTPYGFDGNGNFYTHEDGVNADTSALAAYIESAYLSVTEEDQIMHISKVIPDFERISGSVNLYLKGKKWPQSIEQIKGPYSIDGSIKQKGARMRARYIAIRVESDGQMGTCFRMGSWRARMVADGER